MSFKATGIIIEIGDIKATKRGTAVQQIHFEQENGQIIYPSAIGPKVEILENFLPGDVVELEFYINGSKGVYNNVMIEKVSLI